MVKTSRWAPRLVISLLLPISSGLMPAQTVESWEERFNALQPPGKVMDAIGVKPGMVVGEVGAGRGRYTVHLARRVGPAGKIFANDIEVESLDYVRARCRRDGIANVETVIGTVDDPRFPKASLDMAFMIQTYHHLKRPVDLLRNLIPSLKPGATVVIVDPDPLKDTDRDELESTAKEKMEREAAAAGFTIARIETFLEKDNIYILRVKGRAMIAGTRTEMPGGRISL